MAQHPVCVEKVSSRDYRANSWDSPEPKAETIKLHDVLVANKRPIRKTIFLAWI